MPLNQRKAKSEVVKTDILVLGGGIAGCLAAIKAKESGLDVLLIDKGNVGRSGMSHQMSGVLAYFDPEEDDLDQWYAECIEIGEGMVDQPKLEGMITETTDRIKDLERWGVSFQKDKGKFLRRPGVGHIAARNIAMVDGGFQLMSIVRGEVLRSGVRTLERVMTTDLLTSDGELPTDGSVVGAVGFNIRSGAFYVFEAKAVIIATGSTNSICTALQIPILSGDGKAQAFRAGCEMRNVEFSYYCDYPVGFSCAPGSNILYGQGAILVNALGERFMERYDRVRLDRASRTVHNRAIILEELQGRGPVYLDATHLDESAHATIRACIPIVVNSFALAGLDLRRDKIPYTSGLTDHSPGGIRVDRGGRTTIPGLFAAGAATDHSEDGVTNVIGHGMESAIGGYRAGKAAAHYAAATEGRPIIEDQTGRLKEAIYAPLKRKTGLTHREVRGHCMTLWETGLLGPSRNERKLKEAIKMAEEIRSSEIVHLEAQDYHDLARTIGLGNELLLLELLPRCALMRTESRGSHYREDYPEKDDNCWSKWVIAKREGDSIKVWAEPIPSI